MFGLDNIILTALNEDIGTGDITSLSTIPSDRMAYGRFIAKESGIVCGTEVVERTFKLIDKETEVNVSVKDGDKIEKETIKTSGKAIRVK